MEFPIGKKLLHLVINPGTSRCPTVDLELVQTMRRTNERVPFTAEPEIPEILTNMEAPRIITLRRFPVYCKVRNKLNDLEVK